MRNTLPVFILNVLIVFQVYASDSIVIFDIFQEQQKFYDLSELVIWGDNNEYVSCFQTGTIADDNGLSFSSVFVSLEGSTYSTYYPEINGNPTLRTMSCFDYSFDQIDRSDKIVTIEFDTFWSQYDGGYGEQGRVVVALVDDYPEGGPQVGDIDNLEPEAPFGRPKYNLRLRNSQPVDPSHGEYVHRSPSFMLYGGGLDEEGEFEKSVEWGYWMPGFSSEAGGGPPGQPSASDFPETGTKKSDQPWMWNSVSEWHRYTWVIEPELMSLYMRPSASDEGENVLVSQMAIPKDDLGEDYMIDYMNEVHLTDISSLPPLYNWFPSFEAIRVYFRGFEGNIAYLANFKLSYETIGDPVFVDNLEIPDVQIYPNPTNQNGFYVSEHVQTIQVFDMSGRLQQSFSGIRKGSYVKVSDIKGGMYLVKLYFDKGAEITKKLIVK